MGAHARGLQILVERDPFDLWGYANTAQESIIKQIQKTKVEDAAQGISEVNNQRLKELGQAHVLTSNVLKEISTKFPKKYLELMEIRSRSKPIVINPII